MLFENKILKSKYDFENDLPDELSNLTSLAKEIYRQTDSLYTLWKEREITYFHHTDNNGNNIIVDFNHVSEKTWSRDVAEIKEILFRFESDNGHDQQQFSINKGLKQINVYEPENFHDYKHYLQLLYFFYMINYFAFPNVNIFKKLSEKNLNYNVSYDEGTTEGKYLSFIAVNIFDNEEAFGEFVNKTNSLNEIQEYIAKYLKYICSSYDDYKFSSYHVKTEKQDDEKSVFSQLIYFIHSYAMKSYCNDLLCNLEDNHILYFDELTIPPFENWKSRYIKLEEIDDFLKEDQVYWFCKQNPEKIESRDKHKFLESNAVKFLKEFIEYDKQWIDLFDEEEGTFIEVKDDKQIIYALCLVCIIKTYNDLINKNKIRIMSGLKKKQPLRTLLSNNDDIYPATLAMRFFILACHSQYLNATIDHEQYQQRYEKEFVYPEKQFLEMIYNAYQYNTFEECYDYLCECAIELQNVIYQILL